MAPDAPEPEVAALREAGPDRERAFGDRSDRRATLERVDLHRRVASGR